MSDDTSQPSQVLSFSAWLKRQRRILDLTRDELGRCAHCSPETIKKIESDERLPSKELAGLIADAVSVPPHQRERFIQFARGTNPAFATLEMDSTPKVKSISNATLLETKLFAPTIRSALVVRPRLIGVLKSG